MWSAWRRHGATLCHVKNVRKVKLRGGANTVIVFLAATDPTAFQQTPGLVHRCCAMTVYRQSSPVCTLCWALPCGHLFTNVYPEMLHIMPEFSVQQMSGSLFKIMHVTVSKANQAVAKLLEP